MYQQRAKPVLSEGQRKQRPDAPDGVVSTERGYEMDTDLTGVIASAIIAGVFGLIGKRMEFAHGGGATSLATPIPGQPPAAAASIGRSNFGLILRQVGILQLAINLVAVIVGFSMGSVGANIEEVLVAILFIGTLLLIAGFVWVALSVSRAVRWRHMIAVAVGVAVVTVVINAIFMQIPLSGLALVVALAQAFISMGIGGAIANKIRN